ncbi:unnamed protein product [Macrosiphum euphorbiae]|uniref:MULE transposase domain-containing protein n=1 Tax=Macrosiphum euphorbiae TaxID=13131 RepID=A0AAV0XRH6_9HEMI|nr:unnamed protein product [Macrosiphum euphorbiae]
MDIEGFLYKCTKTTQYGKCYYVCATPNTYCSGTAIKLANGTFVVKKGHSHDPYDSNFNVNQMKKTFRGILLDRAKSEKNPLRVIYDEEAIRNPQAAMLYYWLTAESLMRKARKQAVPPLPSTLRELGEYLDLNINSCQDIIDAVVNQGGTELHADGTFKVVPSVPTCRQLFIIHLILQNHSIPICFVLMETKTEVAYKKVLEQFKTKFPNVRPTSIMIDFETGLHNAFQQTYPEATILSCWFHFVQV